MRPIPDGEAMGAAKKDGQHWVGFDVSSNAVVVVEFHVPTSGAATVEYDDSWGLQTGRRPAAYQVMYDRVGTYLGGKTIDGVAIMGSAPSKFAATGGLLDGAELRGVVAAASAAVTKNVILRSKGSLSRSSNRGKVELYTKDDHYWTESVNGKLRKGSREIAYLVLREARPSDAESV